jgi:hypothetical protein
MRVPSDEASEATEFNWSGDAKSRRTICDPLSPAFSRVSKASN